MPITPNPLTGPRAKAERAKKHVQDLNIALKAFFDSKPYTVGTKHNPNTRQLIYYLTGVAEVPSHIATIAGDAIHNMRASLDYLAYQLVLVGTGSPGPFRYVYFPIFESAKEYEERKLERIKGMRPEAIKAIDLVKPYKGGNDQLWRLHQLDLVDKHRLLITVGSYFQSFDLGAHMAEVMKATFPEFGEVPSLSAFFKPDDKLYPLKAGHELFADVPDAKVFDNMQFRFNVSLSEPQVIDIEPLLTTLQQLIDATERVIESFDSPIFWSP